MDRIATVTITRTIVTRRNNRCSFCGNLFSRADHKKQHENLVHKGIKEFDCSLCGKKFGNKQGKEYHERSHLNLKPFQCLSCGKNFTSSSYLIVHKRTHTGELPYVCQYKDCKKSFRSASQRRTHARAHTGQYLASGKFFWRLRAVRRMPETKAMRNPTGKMAHALAEEKLLILSSDTLVKHGFTRIHSPYGAL